MNPFVQRKMWIADGAFGEMSDDKGSFVCCTMERLFDGKTVIPAGTWDFYRYCSPHFGYEVFRCDTIPGHEAIELHIANFVEQLEGCVGLGEQIGPRFAKPGKMLMKSLDAFKKFMAFQVGVDKIQVTFHD